MRDFLIIANKNIIGLKDVFQDIKNGIVKAGYTTPNNFLDGNGNITTTINGLCRWFTTMPVHKQKTLTLTKTYNPIDYPKFDNYDAINVDRVKDIPMDYDGVMGVPVTFLDKYSPEQFEILGNEYTFNIPKGRCYINGKRQYSRIFIKKRQQNNKFIIIGSQNAINYLCPLVKSNKIWVGYTYPRMFLTPLTKIEDEKKQIEEEGKIYQKFGNICWFTNFDINKRHEKLALGRRYYGNEKYYPKYDNYDAIDVSKVKNIPIDYDGVMGVPISFVNVFCPEQFEIIGITYSKDRNPDVELVRTDEKHRHVGIIDGKEKYPRILIRKKQ